MRTDRPQKPFTPGVDLVHVSGAVTGREEEWYLTALAASDDFHPAGGKYHRELESRLASYVGTRTAMLTNSGSSANLLALSTLRSPLLRDRLYPLDEVISVACGFPTTIAPIVQAGLVPVFVDVELDGNVNVGRLKDALSTRTRAVFFAHALGNPFAIKEVMQFCQDNHLWMIEDCCDALGSTYRGKMCGTFGHLSTFSFYPAHHITTGEGGAVLTNDPLLARVVSSLRDWGRDCWCPSGVDDSCHRRFEQQHGTLPRGYDHKYTYRHLGYNLRMSEMQAALGCAQIGKIEAFHSVRRENWHYYRKELADLSDVLILPEEGEDTAPSPFGFLLALRPGANCGRNELVRRLEARRIQTRMLFAGNITRHPAMAGVHHIISGSLAVSDRLLRDAFWIGVYPGVDHDQRAWVAKSLHEELR